MRRTLLPLLLAVLVSGVAVRSVQARPSSAFSSARSLLLSPRGFPHGYHYRRQHQVDSVLEWDGGLKVVMSIDEGNGWLQGAEEYASDPRHHDAMLSAQVFATAGGARGDFNQFFTNAHPGTRFVPGQTWLGGVTVRGFGSIATLSRVADDSSHCPGHLTTGLSFVYGNAILSVSVCTETVGDKGARALATRMVQRALGRH